jgi:hypothetical protein
LQPAGEWCIERAACGVGEPLHAVCGACWCYPEMCLSSLPILQCLFVPRNSILN